MERKRTAIWRLSHGTKGMFKTTGNLLTTLRTVSWDTDLGLRKAVALSWL